MKIKMIMRKTYLAIILLFFILIKSNAQTGYEISKDPKTSGGKSFERIHYQIHN